MTDIEKKETRTKINGVFDALYCGHITPNDFRDELKLITLRVRNNGVANEGDAEDISRMIQEANALYQERMAQSKQVAEARARTDRAFQDIGNQIDTLELGGQVKNG